MSTSTTTTLSGKALAGVIRQRAQDEARELERDGAHPSLAVVIATDDESTHWYVRSIERAAEAAGIGCRIIDLGHDATEQVLANVLRDLSAEPSVHGIILQTPLPAGVRSDALVGLIAAEKDIDGANPLSLGRLAVGQPPLHRQPPAPWWKSSTTTTSPLQAAAWPWWAGPPSWANPWRCCCWNATRPSPCATRVPARWNGIPGRRTLWWWPPEERDW